VLEYAVARGLIESNPTRLRGRVVAALTAQPPRLDSPLLFPAARGGYIDVPGRERRLHRRREVPLPALDARAPDRRDRSSARLRLPPHVRILGQRRRVQLLYLARITGTSVAQLDATYGHLLPDSEDYLRGLLDAYDEVDGLSTDLAGLELRDRC
jgi:hypothetical protein